MKTCKSKNGKLVTEGAYAFAWDERGSRERVRADEKISEMKKKNLSVTRSPPIRQLGGGTTARGHEGWSFRA